jgi:hypothetical protein
MTQSEFTYQVPHGVSIGSIVASTLISDRLSEILYFDFQAPMDIRADFSIRVALPTAQWPLLLNENSGCSIYLNI